MPSPPDHPVTVDERRAVDNDLTGSVVNDPAAAAANTCMDAAYQRACKVLIDRVKAR